VDQRADTALDGLGLVLILVCARVIGLVLTNRVTLVVEDCPSVADPAQVGAGVDEHGVTALIEDKLATLVALGRETRLGLGLDQ
jgi:hypothetical protein